jgi:tetratricopeptide (TPR) repeat protein
MKNFDKYNVENDHLHYNDFGAQLLECGKYEEAAKYFQKAIDKCPEDDKRLSVYYYNLSYTQFKLKDFKNGYENLINSLKNCPKSDQKRIDKIINVFDNYNEVNDHSYYNNFAAEIFKCGRYQKAKKYLYQAIINCPKSDKKNLKLYCSNLSEIKKALTDKKENNDEQHITNSATEAYVNGFIFYMKGDTENAVQSFTEALKINDKNSQKDLSKNQLFDIYCSVADLGFEVENYSKSHKLYEIALDLDVTNDTKAIEHVKSRIMQYNKENREIAQKPKTSPSNTNSSNVAKNGNKRVGQGQGN